MANKEHQGPDEKQLTNTPVDAVAVSLQQSLLYRVPYTILPASQLPTSKELSCTGKKEKVEEGKRRIARSIRRRAPLER